jgi:hypothetical protein
MCLEAEPCRTREGTEKGLNLSRPKPKFPLYSRHVQKVGTAPFKVIGGNAKRTISRLMLDAV